MLCFRSFCLCAVIAVFTTVAFAKPLQSPPPAKLPSIAEKTSALQKLDGFFPLYWDVAAGILYLEIPRLDTEVLYVTGLGSGMGSNDIGLDRGLLVDTRIVIFERIGTKVLMTQPNYDYRAITTDANERRAVEDAFAKSVIWGFTAVAETAGRVLVDTTEFLMRDATNIIGSLRPGTYRFERSRSAVFMENTKSFPKNTEIEVTSTFVTDNAGAGPGTFGGRIQDVTPSPDAMTVRQHHSLMELPDANYKPRLFDPRAGFFNVSYLDFSAPFGADTRTRFIARHRLEKRDPNAPVSDPVKPIVYYVDRGTPEPIRSALITGASWWNQAFEAAGFRNAFRVEVMPEGVDPMDARYNAINWVHRSTRGWSYGSSIIDPRTGEIIKGHVSLGSLRAQQDYLIGEGLLSPYKTGEEHPQILTEMVLARLRQLSAHEVGHTLGLQHNYYDSTLGRISVMDYPHPLITLRSDGSLDFTNAYGSGIGEWDKLAIRYGYGQYPASSEKQALQGILDEGWNRDLRFLTNQDTDLNPRVDQWNNGTDVAAELHRIMDIRRSALSRLGEETIQKDWPMALIEDALVPAYLHHRYAVEAAASAVAGQNYIYALRGDGKPPVEWVPAATQKAALDALIRTLRPSELVFSKSLLAKIPPRPSGFGRTRELFPRTTGMAFDPITPAAVAADITVGFLLANERAARMVAQKAVDPSLPGLENVIDLLVASTFDARTTNSYEAEVNRAVQQVVVKRIIDLADTSPMPQVRAIARQKLKQLQARVLRAPAPLTSAEIAGREALADDIKAFLNRPVEPGRRPAPIGTPPGAPIGDSPLEYLMMGEGPAL
jgi:hypothetical protein